MCQWTTYDFETIILSVTSESSVKAALMCHRSWHLSDGCSLSLSEQKSTLDDGVEGGSSEALVVHTTRSEEIKRCDRACMLVSVGSWFGNFLSSESALSCPVPFLETHNLHSATLKYLYSFCIAHTLCMHGFINRGGSAGLFLVQLSCIMCTNRGQSWIINLIGLDSRAMLPH